MPLSKAKYLSNKRYNEKTYVQTAIKSRAEFCLNSRIESASKDAGMSKNAFLLYIIEKALSDAGYPRPEGNND